MTSVGFSLPLVGVFYLGLEWWICFGLISLDFKVDEFTGHFRPLRAAKAIIDGLQTKDKKDGAK